MDTIGTAGGLYGYLKNNQNGGTAGKNSALKTVGMSADGTALTVIRKVVQRCCQIEEMCQAAGVPEVWWDDGWSDFGNTEFQCSGCVEKHMMSSRAVCLENMILQNWFFRTAIQQEV